MKDDQRETNRPIGFGCQYEGGVNSGAMPQSAGLHEDSFEDYVGSVVNYGGMFGEVSEVTPHDVILSPYAAPIPGSRGELMIIEGTYTQPRGGGGIGDIPGKTLRELVDGVNACIKGNDPEQKQATEITGPEAFYGL